MPEKDRWLGIPITSALLFGVLVLFGQLITSKHSSGLSQPSES
jgi:hypothetical protein